MPTHDVIDQFLDLDGAKVCFRTYGDPSLKKPVLYFHGLPGSRLEAQLMHDGAFERGLSIIGIDRPGFGRSAFVPRKSPLCWIPMVAKLTRALEIKKCKVLGVSGGGPYALAVAHEMPDIVEAGVVVSSATPFTSFASTKGMVLPSRLILQLVKNARQLGRAYVALVATGLRFFPGLGVLAVRFSSSADRKVLSDRKFSMLFRDNFLEAILADGRGAQDDVTILSEEWEFLSKVKPPFTIYHGDADRVVPIQSGFYLKEKLPNAQLKVFPNEGHLLVVNQVEKILDDLAG